MQGRQDYQQELFSIFNMEELIPKNHLLREIDQKIDFASFHALWNAYRPRKGSLFFMIALSHITLEGYAG